MPTLSWLGKEKVVNHHLDVPFFVLDKKYSFATQRNATQRNATQRNATQRNIIPRKSI
jgi:adenine-specific DNA-methyltransferase